MGHSIRAYFGRNLNQPLGDQRPGDRGAQQIKPLVKRIGPEHREDEIAHEFFADIFDIDVVRVDPQKDRFLAGGFKLFPLTQIGSEGYNLTAVFGLQPFQDDRGIKPAGIGEDNFLGCRHHWLRLRKLCAGLLAFALANKRCRGPLANSIRLAKQSYEQLSPIRPNRDRGPARSV